MTRRVKSHIRLGIAQFLGLIRVLARTFCGVSSRNVGEFLSEMSRSFSANFRGVSPRIFAEKTLGEMLFLFFSAKRFIFFLGLIYIYPNDCIWLSFFSFFLYVLTSVEDIRRGSVYKCKGGGG